AVIGSVRAKADIAQHARIEEGDLYVVPVFLVERPVPLQTVVEEFRLPADLLVGQVVGREGQRRTVQLDALWIVDVTTEVAVEGTGRDPLGPGEVREHVGEDVPGHFPATPGTGLGVTQISPVDVGGGGQTGRRSRLVATKTAGYGTLLEIVEMKVPGTAGDGQ